MIASQRISSFMISDILKCDQTVDTFHSNNNLSKYNSFNSSVNTSFSRITTSPSEVTYDWDISPDTQKMVSSGPSMDTIVLQHYLLRQRMLMRAKPRKGGQIRFTTAQSVCLERHFSRQKYLSPSERKGIATELSLSERQIKTWFQNRRAKWRRCKQFNEEDSGDNTVLYNKHKDMHSCSRDNDNDDHRDCYHRRNSSQQHLIHNQHNRVDDLGLDFTLINFTQTT